MFVIEVVFRLWNNFCVIVYCKLNDIVYNLGIVVNI